MKKFVVLFLSIALLLTGCGCRPTNLMAEIPERRISVAEVPEGADAVGEFALQLFQNCLEDQENTLISPLSVLTALGMTANGAQGETLAQMEQVLGLPVTDLNAWLYAYRECQGEELKQANAIWFRDDPALRVEQDFLETNADFYQADLYQAAFDANTLAAINDWVSQKTDGQIPDILSEFPDAAMLCLLNALSFDAKWETVYQAHQVREQTFTKEDGTEQTVEMMRSEEGAYLEDGQATGFVKFYEGGRYAFAALLPREDLTVAEYVSGLTGAHLRQLLAAPQETAVFVSLPKFETTFSAELSVVLQAMGMTDAFSGDNADFSAMGRYAGGNLSICQVLHKTAITVSEQGTQAGAATAVIMAAGESAMEETKYVVLDRPFVYLIFDRQQNLPIFLGTLMDAGQGPELER